MIRMFIVTLVVDGISFDLIIKMLISLSDEICFIYFRTVVSVGEEILRPGGGTHPPKILR
jgi:hypothetical protein